MSEAQATANQILYDALDRLKAADVPAAVTVDRLLTFAAAMSVSIDGAAHASEQFRSAADLVEAGAFAKFEPHQH